MILLQDFYDAGLSPLEVKNTYSSALHSHWPKSPDSPVGCTRHANVLWAHVLLKKVPNLSSEQRMLVLASLNFNVFSLESPPTQCLLVFADGQCFTHTNMEGFVDLKTGEPVEKLTSPFIMSVTYNLSEFIRRQTAEVAHAKDSADGNGSEVDTRES